MPLLQVWRHEEYKFLQALIHSVNAVDKTIVSLELVLGVAPGHQRGWVKRGCIIH